VEAHRLPASIERHTVPVEKTGRFFGAREIRHNEAPARGFLFWGLTAVLTTGSLLNKEVNMSAVNIKDFPKELHHAAKVSAVKNGKSLRDWIIEAVREKLEREKEEL
jgi:hypothetical protein